MRPLTVNTRAIRRGRIRIQANSHNPFSFAVAALVLLPTPNAIAAALSPTSSDNPNLLTSQSHRRTIRRATRNLVATAITVPFQAFDSPAVEPAPASTPAPAANTATTAAPEDVESSTTTQAQTQAQTAVLTPTQVSAPLPAATATSSPILVADANANTAKIDPQTTDVQESTSRLQALIPNKSDTPRQKAMKCLALLCLLSAVATVGTIGVFWVIQDGLVYKPTSVWRGTPKAFGMPDYDDVSYKTSDGETIRGWFIRRPGREYLTTRTIIYFHGTDKNASFRLKKVLGLYEQCAANVLLISYRGYGLSTGHPNEQGLRRDAEGALHYLVGRGDVDVTPGGSRLWVYGESLGGAVALYFTERFQTRVNALVLENTFTSLLDMITLQFPILGPARYLSRNRWLSRRRIARVAVPILFLSGLADSYIPPAMMKRMHRAAGKAKFKRFVPFPGGTHNRTWTLPGFYQEVNDFMSAVETDEAGIAPAAIPLKTRVGDAP